MTNPAQALRDLMRVRAAADGTDVVTWFAGDVYPWLPNQAARGPIFGIEGYNVARAVEVEGGYDLLTREAVFYLDPRTREIIDTWENPFTHTSVDVIHIWNDPVNQRLREQMLWGPFSVPTFEAAGEVTMKLDVFLAYPNPLPPADFPEESGSDVYQAAEMFGFTARRDALDSAASSVPAHVSWTRIAPWLPFMKMGSQEGHLVYHAEGTKLTSFENLREDIRKRVERDGPHFVTAPREFSEPNQTSWTAYRDLKSR